MKQFSSHLQSHNGTHLGLGVLFVLGIISIGFSQTFPQPIEVYVQQPSLRILPEDPGSASRAQNARVEKNLKYYAQDLQRKRSHIYCLVYTCPKIEQRAMALAQKGDVKGALREMRKVEVWCERYRKYLEGLYYTGDSKLLLMISGKAKYYLNRDYLMKMHAVK